MLGLIDTHCHLNMPPLGKDTPAALSRAANRGVTRVIVPSYDLASWPEVLKLSGQQNVFAAVGLHPWVAELEPEITRAWNFGWTQPRPTGLVDQIRLAVTQPRTKVIAIGEIGLDTKVETPTLATQLPVLEAQLQLAVDLDLPVILHCRGAFEELLNAVNNHGGKLRGVLHAFSRSREVAEQFIKAGLFIGLGGAVTRPNARRVRKAAGAIPLERIVLETDAPSIGLDGVLAENTEPGHVRDIAEAIAAIRGETLATIAGATTTNACLLFNLPA